MELRQCIEDYLGYLRHEQGAALTTCKGYHASLHHFLSWAQAHGYANPTLSDLSTPLLRRYLYVLSGESLRPRTIRGYFAPLKAMCVWLMFLGAITEDPCKALTLPKKDAAIRKVTSEEEIAGLLEACERQRNPVIVARSRAVLSVLIFSALRRQEMLDLHVTDVNLKEGSILVRSGKGANSRTVYVCDRCIVALKEWLSIRNVTNGLPYLFTADKSRRLYFNGLKAILETCKTIAGYADRAWIQPHSLRHAAATRLLRAGADIRTVQAYLGHSQLSTTAIYCHSNEENMRSARDLTDLRPSSPDGEAARGNGKGIHLPQAAGRQEVAARLPSPFRDKQRRRVVV